MKINGIPNKFEIFQDYYYDVNGESITYAEALKLFSRMDEEERSNFEQYYKDETGYEIIAPKGFELNSKIILTENGTKDVKRKKKDENGKVVKDDNGKIVYETVTVKNYDSNLSKFTKGLISTKYTIEAYAKENGIILDPIWSQYSAEEIIQMENEGVNIPQDIIDIAHTIYESTGVNLTDSEGENEDGETTEKAPFLNLIPEAVNKIEKCQENTQKISEEIEKLIPAQKESQKKLAKEQNNTLEEYKSNVREWQTLNKKINNGEQLSEKENKRYEQLSEILNTKKDENDGLSINKAEITGTLNEINILATLGKDLADKTIEIGDTLSDYTSQTNYKATRKQASAEIGFFAAMAAMIQGKKLAVETTDIGNETDNISSESQKDVNDIASMLDIQISSVEIDENGEIINSDNNESETTENTDTEEDTKKDKFFYVTDAEVLKYIDEGKAINADLKEKIKTSVKQIKVAKKDTLTAVISDRKVTTIVNKFKEEEEKRQQEIQKKEKEIENSQKEIEKIKEEYEKEGENEEYKEYEEYITDKPENKEKDPAKEKEYKEEIKKHEDIIASSTKHIEQIKNVSLQAREDVKTKTVAEKKNIDKAVPIENEALKANAKYQEQELPVHNERMDFINQAGINLITIGTNVIGIGSVQVYIGQALMSNPFTFSQGVAMMSLGLATIAKGNVSVSIGTNACKVSDDESLIEEAGISIDSAGQNINIALDRLINVDEKLTAVTQEYTNEKADAAGESDDKTAEGQTEDNSSENNTTTASITDTNVEASVNDIENTPAATVAAVPQSVEAPDVEEVPEEPTTPKEAEAATKDVQDNSKDGKAPETQSYRDKIKAIMNSNEKPAETSSQTNTNSKKKDEVSMDAETADKKDQSEVKDAGNSANEDSKESEKLKKETEKDEKQLLKESKKIEKQMQKDQKEIEKMNNESQKSAEKQAELFVQYEELVAESEQLIAQSEQKQASSPVQSAQNAQGEQQSGTTAGFAINGGEDNSQKLQENDQRITTLGTEFKINGNIITRNQIKTKKLEKRTKTNEKQLTKKCKLRTKKLKEAQKKEEKKQKNLQKVLGAVGIAENLFAITSAVGTLKGVIGGAMVATGTAMLSNPFTAAAGAALVSAGTVFKTDGGILVTIGGYGTAACGVTKGAINMANGNLTAGLISIGSAAISAVTCGAGGAAASGAVLSQVSAGLSIVSSSAELVNNVRAVQGKEANGVMSKISTIAGVASSVTNSAEGLKNIGNTTGTFGKAATIASAVGTAASATSQIMTEFGEENGIANILGMVGGGLQTVSSVAQLAQKFSGAEAKNNQNKEDQNETNNDTNPDGTPKTEEQKKFEAKRKQDEQKLQKKAEQQKKTAENAKKQDEIVTKGDDSKYSQQGSYVANSNQGQDNGISGRETDLIKDKTGSYIASSTEGIKPAQAGSQVVESHQGAETHKLQKIEDKKPQIDIKLATKEDALKSVNLNAAAATNNKQQSFLEKAQPWLEAGTQAMSVVGQVLNASNNNQQGQKKQKQYVPQWDRKKMKRIEEIRKKRLIQQQYASKYRRA